MLGKLICLPTTKQKDQHAVLAIVHVSNAKGEFVMEGAATGSHSCNEAKLMSVNFQLT
jgi:hypothetical protein